MESRKLAEFVANLKYSDLTENAIEQSKMCIEDMIGVSIGGSIKPAGAIFMNTMRKLLYSEGQCTVWAKGFPKVGALEAASINGSSGHTLDMDDLHNSSIVHIGIVTIPAAFSIAEELGLSGKDLITAVVAGYDVAARIGEAINPSSYKYWHTTGVAGNFSASAVASKLMGMDATQINYCFGSAGSQAAGLLEFLDDGAMSKSLHTAKANFNGLLSAYLTEEGFTGASKILEGNKGFVKAVAPEYHLSYITDNFANPLRIETNSFKPYACCRHIHSGIYAIQELVRQYKIKPDHVNRIVDRTYQVAIETASSPDPKTIYGHKFSIEYCLAAALVFGDVLPETFSEKNTQNKQVKSLMSCVTAVVDPSLDAEYMDDPNRWLHEVDIYLKNGERLTKRVEYPIGDYMNPYKWVDIDR